MPRHRIDTHSHYLPDFYREALQANGHSKPDGMPAVPVSFRCACITPLLPKLIDSQPWSEKEHLEMMDKLNIEKSYISISSPGVYLTPTFGKSAVELARKCNAFAADLKKRHPDRFGFFAVTPLPLVQEALEEIDRAFAEGADGVGLESNHEGVYLGDERFDPIFAELNKRKAKLFIHPTTPCFCPSGTQGAGTEGGAIKVNPLAERYPSPMMEFLYDTSRAVANLFLSGTVSKYPDITYLIPHMGGAMPPLFSRFLGFGRLVPGDNDAWEDEDALAVLNKRFYFDLVGVIFLALAVLS